MRNVTIVILLSSFFLVQCNENNNKSKKQDGTPEIVFDEYEYQFGNVAEGEKMSHQFTFENKGTGDLIINSVSTTCGCTVPKYTSKPVSPGEKGKIEVIFDTSGKNGMQTKTITVNSNASKPVLFLRITAEVEQK